MHELHPDIARVIISQEDIQARVVEIAAQLEDDYAHADEIYLIAILKGAFIFLSDLARCLTKRHIVDFMAVSSYGMTTTTGAVRILMDLREPIQHRHVVIVEDILDSGNTLAYLYHALQERRPASLKTCVLLKKDRDHAEVPIDYLGFEIPDVWVVGYGLDFAETHRTLPYIGELKPEVYQDVD
jgi:hypoxanthine phosphoribosyltransferase